MQKQSDLPPWEAIVIGGGAAGLSAALMLGRARRRVLVIDAGSPRNRFAAHMHGVLGNEGTPPGELTARGRDEVSSYGGQFLDAAVDRVETHPGGVRVLADGAAHTARALIVATGITDDLPDIPGLAERWGKSVLHCPYCHGWEFKDRRLGVLATSPAALHQAQLIRQWSDRVTLFAAAIDPIERETAERLRSRGVDVVDAEVIAVVGEGDAVTAVRTADGKEVPVEAIFTASSPRPHDGFLQGLDLARNDLPFGMGSFLAVDQAGKTSNDRIWAVGNVVNPMANVPMSIGSGSFTGGAVNGALVEEEFDRAQEALGR
ncbi:MAG TPA: NAD(P)/FAD-dependent oxidoreductase [Candidatus Agrococcus pullicola]|uniref:NAD(P)/FAD-dependent oxidoreductase n=1 Tax=Candidatus Agrococcus pullicola TaxID=2838429 RepID=A0A9D1YXI9_9MICO|nr:NAD(P)/FAD-dependent oxidoreductase [Candidatus Agrococcus pullicola]